MRIPPIILGRTVMMPRERRTVRGFQGINWTGHAACRAVWARTAKPRWQRGRCLIGGRFQPRPLTWRQTRFRDTQRGLIRTAACPRWERRHHAMCRAHEDWSDYIWESREGIIADGHLRAGWRLWAALHSLALNQRHTDST